MVIVDLAGGTRPRIVDEGGEFIQTTIDLRGIAALPSGLPRVITPRWSADGKWIAFLRNSSGQTPQVWRAFADGSGSAPLTHAATDVVDFRIGGDGSTIVYATRPDIDKKRKEIERDGLNGWNYDNRSAPFISKEPQATTPADRVAQVLDLRSGGVRGANAEEAAPVLVGDEVPAGAGAPLPTNVPGLEILATNLSATAKAGSLKAHLADGTTASCTALQCEGARRPWWAAPSHRHVRFLRTEGWANASTAIYDWDVRSGVVRRLYLTDDLLASCTPSSESLICLMHSSLTAGQLIRLDPGSGRRTLVFDLNPEIAHRILGQVRAPPLPQRFWGGERRRSCPSRRLSSGGQISDGRRPV